MKRPYSPWSLLVTAVIVVGVAAGWVTAAQAQTDSPAGRPPVFTATPEPTRVSLSAIRLSGAGAPATAWTVMQWQDGLGGWHDVEGWRGEFDPDGFKTWRFPEQHFGTGPFRWQVFDRRGGDLWGVSQPFRLPDGRDQMLDLTITPP